MKLTIVEKVGEAHRVALRISASPETNEKFAALLKTIDANVVLPALVLARIRY
jgi:hypothetical protein